MATLVCFHAHPDDEAVTTSGTMAKAAADGHRVVLVVATGGEHGEVPDDLAPGESLLERRRAETLCSADAIGIDRVAWLGYEDSGMTGWQQNANPASFVQADLDEAGARLAAILTEEAADVLTVYDWHGGYGHPDHIRVHAVGHLAAELAATPHVYEATFNRDYVMRQMAGFDIGPPSGGTGDSDSWTDDGRPFGSSESEITTQVEVFEYVDVKRASLQCHASQATDSSFFLTMPEEGFAKTFGIEWYIRTGAAPEGLEHALAGLD